MTWKKKRGYRTYTNENGYSVAERGIDVETYSASYKTSFGTNIGLGVFFTATEAQKACNRHFKGLGE